jgi:hypothetical protein
MLNGLVGNSGIGVDSEDAAFVAIWTTARGPALALTRVEVGSASEGAGIVGALVQVSKQC